MAIRIPLVATVTLLALLQQNQLEAAEIQLPAHRGFGRAVVIDGSIYFFGARNSAIEILDTEQNTWSRAEMGLRAPQILGDQIDGQLYLLDPVSRKFLRFDPTTKRTHKLTPIPSRRINGTLIAAAGKLFVIGAYSQDVTRDNCVEVYDPEQNRWSIGPPLPGYHQHDHFHSAAVLNGKLHVVGGLLDGNNNQPHWRLDGNRWTKRAQPPLHTMWKHTALAAVGKQLILIAPHPATPQNQSIDPKHDIHAYNPAADRWQPIGHTPKNIPHGLFAQAVVANKIFLLGGPRSKAIHTYNVTTGKWK